MDNWSIIKHWAELALALAVWHMFGTCNNFADALTVIRDADDVTRLGIVTASTIAVNGFVGIVTALARWLRLAEARRLFSLIQKNRRRRPPGADDRGASVTETKPGSRSGDVPLTPRHSGSVAGACANAIRGKRRPPPRIAPAADAAPPDGPAAPTA